MDVWYILGDDNEPISATIALHVAWMVANERRCVVKQEEVGDAWVSTMFLGQRAGAAEPPQVFETMIFWEENPKLHQWQRRYATWDEAVVGHQEAVELVRG